MRASGLRRVILGAAMLASMAMACAAEPPAGGVEGDRHKTEPAEPTAGELLIASAGIQDPRFSHTVILLLRHDETGAFGIVINRPIEERSIASLIEAAGDAPAPGGKKAAPNAPPKPAPDPDSGDRDAPLEGKIEIYAGGPVQPQLGFVLHSTDYHRPETMEVDGQIAMTASKEVLRDIGRHRGPKQSLFALGYAGWGPGQLEAEIARRDWFTAPDDPALVFDEQRDGLWNRALARRMREL